MRPLKVTAQLYNGFAASDDWSPALDGILAYWKLRLADPDHFLTTQGRSDLMTPVDGLPLERIEDGDWWWYACSSPIYTLHEQHRRYFHRRFDDQQERFLPADVKSVLTSAGPYKNYRKSLMLRVTAAVVWHCIGDAEAIRALLNACHHIGSKPSQGYGRVKQWQIEEDGDESLALFHRPLPVDYARGRGIDGPVMRWGLRPPVRIAANLCECVMPGSEQMAQRCE
jgi:CRISPR type IV-associated protein Csf3